jgi:uncharacterized membrane protein YdjX (TVP38/TMEM64 family)
VDNIQGQKGAGNVIRLMLNLVFLLLFTALIVFAAARYAPVVTKLAGEPEKMQVFLASYRYRGILIFIALQFIQVVIAVIPGELVQVAGGYVYGTLQGTVYSMIGIFTGYVVNFFISRLFGYRMVKLFVPADKIKKLQIIINSRKSEIVTFLLFLIPGLPKDFLVYIAGLTPVKPGRFFILTMIARFPALIGSSYIGANLQQENYLAAVSVSALAVVLFASGLLLRGKIIEKLKGLGQA